MRTGLLAVGAVGLAGLVAAAPGGRGQASLKLENCDLALCNRSDTAWDLTKELTSVDFDAGTLVFTVTATRGATTDNFITANGFLRVSNTGSADATIGNIVVNLTKKAPAPNNNTWVSQAANVADATSGDQATQANILAAASNEDPVVNALFTNNYSIPGNNGAASGGGTFYETSASGQLMFTDTGTNTVWTLSPQQIIPPGGWVDLQYSASFNNTLMQIPDGEHVRVEVIVTFGNSGGRGDSGASGQNIDINGDGNPNGGDERYVRSVPCRISLPLPATTACNASVTLTDPGFLTTGTADATGFDNGGIGGGVALADSATYTVTVTGASAGSDGGTIKNCAQLVGESSNVVLANGTEFACCVGVDLERCAESGFMAPSTSGSCTGTTYTRGGFGAGGNGTPDDLMYASYVTDFSPQGLKLGRGGVGNQNGGTNTANWGADADSLEVLRAYLNGKTLDIRLITECECEQGYRLEEDNMCHKRNQPNVAPTCTTTEERGFVPCPNQGGGMSSNALGADSLNAYCLQAGQLGIQTATLTLNVVFDDSDHMGHTQWSIDPDTGEPVSVPCDGTKLGDMVLCNSDEDAVLPSLEGKTIREALGAINLALAGGGLPDGYSFSALNTLADNLNNGWHDGDAPSQWAADHVCEPAP